MKASIVTPAYNSLQYLKYTIASLEKQDIDKENFEVVVIDDGSTDGMSEYLKSYKGSLNFIPVINPKNLGRAKSRNRGIEVSHNEIIIFVDSDIEVKPDFVRIHLEEHAKGKRACVGRVLFHPSLEKNNYMKYLECTGSARVNGGEKMPGKYFRTTNASVPKDILIETGCFDENFIYYGGEDTELGMRIAEQIDIIYLPEAVGYNRHSRTLEKSLEIIKVYGEKSLPYLLKKRPELKAEMMLENKFYSPLLPLLCSSLIYGIVKASAKINLVPQIAYSYLLFRNYRKGYKESL
jgi:glycosyltransferase involved in cell wall biosynthesis